MKNFRFKTICNITQEPQNLQTFNCACGFIGKSAVIKYHQLLSKVQCINWKSCFDQLATASSSISLKPVCSHFHLLYFCSPSIFMIINWFNFPLLPVSVFIFPISLSIQSTWTSFPLPHLGLLYD